MSDFHKNIGQNLSLHHLPPPFLNIFLKNGLDLYTILDTSRQKITESLM